MVATVRIALLLILLMALIPPWRGRPGSAQSPEESAGYAFLVTPPHDKEVSGNRFGWVEIRIDAGRLMVQCLIVAAVAGLVVTYFRSKRAGRGLDQRLDELAKAFHQFRGSLNDVIGSQRDAVEASREKTEEEAARALTQKDRPA